MVEESCGLLRELSLGCLSRMNSEAGGFECESYVFLAGVDAVVVEA